MRMPVSRVRGVNYSCQQTYSNCGRAQAAEQPRRPASAYAGAVSSVGAFRPGQVKRGRRTLYKNQYYVSDVELHDSRQLVKLAFGNLHVYSHPPLNVSFRGYRSTRVLLLGYALDPLKPQETTEDIVLSIAETCDTTEALFRRLQLLSGRFVLLYRNGVDFIALNDACGLRQLYYYAQPGCTILTSSIRMFIDVAGSELQTSRLKQDFIELSDYEFNECAWFGDRSIDDRLMKVLPNHFVNMSAKTVHRIPVYHETLVRPESIVEYSSAVLEGSIGGIVKRYQAIQPLTAGWDSRLLLAASKHVKDRVQYYVIDPDPASRNTRHPDVWVPRRLSAQLGIKCEVVLPDEVKEEFVATYGKEHVFPRMTKVQELQYHYDNNADRGVIRVSGIGGEIIRCFYGVTKHNCDARMLASFSGYSMKSQFVIHEIDRWLDGAREYCEQYNVPLLDLFYWEQRMGNWGALYPFEQDIAIEEFCPFCNRNLILSMWMVDSRKRSAPGYSMFREIIQSLWAETLAEPLNPGGVISYVRMCIRRHSMLRYRVRSLLGLR